MVGGQLVTVLRRLHAEAGAGTLAALTDGQLLEEFTGRHREAAFEALLRRHGPMVLGVCRRVLGDAHGAEDAFQATFLVLFRRAPALDRRGPLAGWLHAVAYHVALRARAEAARRRRREREAHDMRPAEPTAEEAWDDLRPVLDEELQRLPDECRPAVVLCYLEGKTNEDAARQLGLPPGTLKSRLARARRILRERLARRGVTLSAGALAAALAGRAPAAVPSALVRATAQAARLWSAGKAAGLASVALAEGVLKTMFTTKLKTATVLLLGIGALLLAAAALGPRAAAQPQAGPPPEAKPAGDGKEAPPA